MLKIRTVFNCPQEHLKKEMRILIFIKLTISQIAILFSDNLPLLGGVLHNNVVRSDLSLSTAHSEPHTNIVEFCGLNPVPVTVMVWPPPKLPSKDIKKEKQNEIKENLFYDCNFILKSDIEVTLMKRFL